MFLALDVGGFDKRTFAEGSHPQVAFQLAILFHLWQLALALGPDARLHLVLWHPGA